MSTTAASLRNIAEATLASISSGKVIVKGMVYDLSANLEKSTLKTAYYGPDSLLSAWSTSNPAQLQSHPSAISTVIDILETTTLAAARRAAQKGYKRPIGVLNFASAHQPGGGFINGTSAQEESIARSSTLYASLMTPTGQQFYRLHSAEGKNGGFYTHAMIYSPHVVAFRTDEGAFEIPMEIDVLTSPAVHAGLARTGGASAAASVEAEITRTMRERMARILFLFERRNVRNLILGSFGTGVFQNDTDTVAGIWAELLCGPDARFGRSFEYVAFAVIDSLTYERFKAAFERGNR
ncbi:hypothetical protein C8R43DRAFT_1009470 [Mycena crocata]|nr:hypothetical protein C8R43DRAFT_1009470 [Mycena crocata]